MSTIKIAKKLDVSQQTVSRILIEMEKEGIIIRKVSNAGIEITLTDNGVKILRDSYQMLRAIFDRRIPGVIKTGLGEGGYYIKKYAPAIKKTLNFLPFPGTLNVIADAESIRLIQSMEAIILESFRSEGRFYGEVYCYPASIDKVKGAVIIPKLTHHKNTLEFIASVDIRKKLKLKDGDQVLVHMD